MKPCPVRLTVSQAHLEKTDGVEFVVVTFDMTRKPVDVFTDIADFGPSLDAAVKAARERFYAEGVPLRPRNPNAVPGTVVSVTCLAKRKPAGFDAATRKTRFEAASEAVR